MRTPNSPSTGARLGTRLRGALAEAYGLRGHGTSNLWFGYSPKAKADAVLHSDIEFGHFLIVESDPDIQEVDYNPARVVASVGGEAVGTIVDAVLKRRNGSVVWRELKRSEDVAHGAQTRANLQLMIQMKAAGLAGVTHELLTEEQVFAQPQRIYNWLRIIPWLAQARELPLFEYRKTILKFVRTRREVQFLDVLALGNDSKPEAALYGAGLFSAVQYGLVKSDLDVSPLTLHSRFYATGEA